MDIGLLYWAVRLFGLKLNWKTSSIDSSVQFTPAQFQSFTNIAVVVALLLSSLTLLCILLKSVVCSLSLESGWRGKIWSSMQTLFFGCESTDQILILS